MRPPRSKLVVVKNKLLGFLVYKGMRSFLVSALDICKAFFLTLLYLRIIFVRSRKWFNLGHALDISQPKCKPI